VARRRLTIALAPILAGAVEAGADDDVTERVLDVTAELLVAFGLSRWSVDDVAERAGLSRTSVYRRFPSRDDLVHGVLARELRRTIAAIGEATSGQATLEDRVVEAALVALAALDGSVVDRLLQTDPATVLPFLTTGAGPLVDLARGAFAPALVAAGVAADGEQAEVLAETLARLGLSFVLTRPSVLPLDDPAAMRAAVRALVGPLLRTGLGSPA
jgi:AcrR family transcriptional regulator